MDAVAHDTPVRVDHVGIAVRDVGAAETVLRALGCERISDQAVVDDRSVPYEEAGPEARFRWTYYRLGDASRIELIEPIADDTFLTDFLDEHGPGLHHVTLEVADVDAVIDAVEAAGFSVVDRESFSTWTEAFVSPRNPTGTLVQLMEYHDDYDEGKSTAALFVNGARVEDAIDVERGANPPGEVSADPSGEEGQR